MIYAEADCGRSISLIRGYILGSPLGRLERVELRNIWASEAADFTPWLAQSENLEVLAQTLGVGLELEAQEKSVGPFRADILCKDAETDNWVLIENQLERTDHGHLGQLLTYASGLEAATIAWVARQFTEEHRSTLGWLNKITDERFRFFGLEVELWRIGESPAAPKFNVVSKPNDWSRSVVRAARAIDEAALTPTRQLQLAYWTSFNAVLDEVGGPVSGARKPRPASWMGYSVGKSHFRLTTVMGRWDRRVQGDIYITGDKAKAYFHLLRAQQEEIEAALGFALDWQELPDGKDSRISSVLEDTDPEAEADWRRQHLWLADRLNTLHRVFSPLLRQIDPDDWDSAISDDMDPIGQDD